jgi:hypothetical protein
MSSETSELPARKVEEGHHSDEGTIRPQWAICWILAATLLAAGWFLCDFLDSHGLTSPHLPFLNVTYYLFGAYDRILLLPWIAVAGLLFFQWTRPAKAVAQRSNLFAIVWLTAGIATAVLILTSIGTYFICQDFPLPMDEYFARLQVQFFRDRQLVGHIAPEWQPYADAMTAPLLGHDPVGHTWIIGYHPVYSFMRLAFGWIGLESLTNAFLSAACIALVAAAARRLWPNNKESPVVAIVLLATSAQFLVYGMTSYTMQAHLCLNLAWLVLFLSPSAAQRAFAPWVGIAALCLHQPNVHAIFVAPFLVRLLWERRWRRAAYFAAVYLVGIVIWLLWLKLRAPIVTPGGHDAAGPLLSAFAKQFTLPGRLQGIQLLVNFDFLIGWNSIFLVILGGFALLRFRHLDRPQRDLAWGLILAVAFYSCFSLGQGHGWGYRYLHPYLGNLVLLAVTGSRMMANASPDSYPRVRRLLVASTLLAIIVQIPFRLWEVREFTIPFAAASRYLHSLPYDVVVISENGTWYARDLVRNSPDAGSRPKIMSAEKLTKENARLLLRDYRVRFVDHAELSQFGMFDIDLRSNGKP